MGPGGYRPLHFQVKPVKPVVEPDKVFEFVSFQDDDKFIIAFFESTYSNRLLHNFISQPDTPHSVSD